MDTMWHEYVSEREVRGGRPSYFLYTNSHLHPLFSTVLQASILPACILHSGPATQVVLWPRFQTGSILMICSLKPTDFVFQLSQLQWVATYSHLHVFTDCNVHSAACISTFCILKQSVVLNFIKDLNKFLIYASSHATVTLMKCYHLAIYASVY